MIDRRGFLKTTGSMTASGMLSKVFHGQGHTPAATTPPQASRTNWAGCYTYKAAHLDEPSDPAAVQQLVRSQTRVKALGARHSFNGIADTAGDQLQLKHLDGMLLDRATRTVTVGAGVTYGRLAPWLDQQGFAVHNLASLPHVTVAGACATATHGSGSRNGTLSTAVQAFEMVNGRGEVVRLSRDANPDVFPGAVVAMGALGVLTSITLRIVPSFQIAQTIYEDLSFNQLEHNLETIFASGYSVSLFTNWQHHAAQQVWIKKKVDGQKREPPPQMFYGATVQTKKMHPLAGKSPESCTEQMGVPGPWYQRLPHFKMEFTPSSGEEIQSEFFVPREHAYQALLAIEELRDRITPHLFVSEMRTIQGDDLWMSMAYRRDSLAFHFTWKPEMEAVQDVLPAIEAKLTRFGGRPHWAKIFTMPADRVRTLYPQFDNFAKLVAQHDPEHKLSNEYLRTSLGLA